MNRTPIWRALLLVISLSLITLGGCKKKEEPKRTTGPVKAPNAQPWDPSQGTASITGQIRYTGSPKEMKPLPLNDECQECWPAGETPLSESLVLGSDQSLQNVFVWVRSNSAALAQWIFEPPTEPVTINQVGCVYTPHVVGVQVDQPVIIKNSDPLTHNVRANSEYASFNFSQDQGATDKKEFIAEELGLTLKCDIHGWMQCYVNVSSHPFFVVTDANGNYKLEGLPAGDYVLEAWHEKLGSQTLKITLGEGESKADQNFEFGKKGAAR